ncbi:nucleotidyltransferase domain-containing protein [Acanthopleuribacter pedis]|uniref:Nucleotidyltransferase family protein n=1 Tax=Acanthopleuribacter pedis TaxID=442870 RepID=A0A8J7Q2B2_9BACT|nr:nucleotidyltransferase family protein [Acanthopleuribacter pedis]MBO1317970.1 nucleotidyltransferase family protein [Acanthopleuribacter pedis]
MSFDRNALPPEYRILLVCANDPKHPPDPAQLRDTAAAVSDWDFVVAAAVEHRLAPLLFHWLTRETPDLLPGTARVALENHGRERALHMMRLVGYLKQVITSLQQAGIDAMVLKGPMLGQRAFGNMALRPSNDLDIMVRAEDRDRAHRHLQQALGFDIDAHQLDRFSPRQRRHFLAYSHELCLAHSQWNLVLDLHWRTSRFELSQFARFEPLFARAERVPFAGLTVPYFRGDDLFVYLATHGSRHGWLRLFWLNDLVALTRGGHVADWEQVLAAADEHRQRRSVLMGMYLCALLFELVLPEPIERALAAEPKLKRRARSILPRIFPKKRDASAFPLQLPLGFAIRWLTNLNDSRRIRWSTTAQFMFVPNEGDLRGLRLPDALFPAYYLIRPFRLIYQNLFRR